LPARAVLAEPGLSAPDPTLLALLVHRGLLTAAAVREALAAGGDFVQRLVDAGHATRAQWDEWQRTQAGTRKDLKRYELQDLLGEGGTARVFRAVDRKDGAVVALKVLKPEVARDPVGLSRFIRESKLLAELASPHIVRGHRVAREGETVYCAMELVPGQCLQDLLTAGQVLEETEALAVVAQIARALHCLHERGLVHRDVKPGNILWTDEGRAVLIDLGFAVEAGGAAADLVAGTAAYISPEQAKGEAGLDVRADIYSLGATLYHLVTGSLPFEGGSSEEILARQVLDALSSEAIRARALSPQLHYFIEKMMAKEREIRFQSPTQLAEEIEAHLARVEREREAQQEKPSGIRRRRRGR
jgi:serine/threonine-protein kinase